MCQCGYDLVPAPIFRMSCAHMPIYLKAKLFHFKEEMCQCADDLLPAATFQLNSV